MIVTPSTTGFPLYPTLTPSMLTRLPITLSGGASGNRIDTAFSGPSISTAARLVRWNPAKSRFSLNLVPLADRSTPHRSSSFFVRDLTILIRLSSPVALAVFRPCAMDASIWSDGSIGETSYHMAGPTCSFFLSMASLTFSLLRRSSSSVRIMSDGVPSK